MVRAVAAALAAVLAGAAGAGAAGPRPQPPGGSPAQTTAPAPLAPRALLDRYCVTCHNQRLQTGGLALDTLDVSRVGGAPDVWERVVLKLRGGMMPPAGRPRPAGPALDDLRGWLEASLDRAAASTLEPGRVPTHRLNRAEYANAVRDILALDVDAAALLPADDSGHGFDNLAGTLALSPALMERYLSAARRISRLAVGDPTIGPGLTSRTYTVPIAMTQNDRMSEALPFGSRGGLAVRHRFPLDGEYVVTVRLKRSVYEYIVNLDEAHDLDVRIDGRRVARFTVGGAAPGKPAPVSFSGTFVAAGASAYPTQDWDDYRTGADAGLVARIPVRAGARMVGVSFADRSWEREGVLQPQLREYGATVTETTDTSPRAEGPGLESVTIDGPYAATGPGGTASRSRIFVCRPDGADVGGERCARTILARLARRAYPPARRWGRPRSAAGLLPGGAGGGRHGGTGDRGLRSGYPERDSSGSSSIRSSCSASSAIRPAPRPAPPTRSPTWSLPPGCRSFCGAASRTASCSTSRSGADSRTPASSKARCGACSTTPARRPSSTTLRGSGCRCAASPASPRIRISFPASTRTSAKPSGARPSCSSRASFARTGASSTCWARTTRFSTSGWPGTTGFPG